MPCARPLGALWCLTPRPPSLPPSLPPHTSLPSPPSPRDAVTDPSINSPYVAEYCSQLDGQVKALNELVASGQLPAVSRLGIWCAIVSHTMDRLVEGFSMVKRCCVEGRGAMQHDLQSIYAHASKVGPVLPPCLPRGPPHVVNYIQAFYGLSESSLLAWVEANKAAYPLRQVRSILDTGLAPSLGKAALKAAVLAVDRQFCVPMDDGTRLRGDLLKASMKFGASLVNAGEAMLGH